MMTDHHWFFPRLLGHTSTGLSIRLYCRPMQSCARGGDRMPSHLITPTMRRAILTRLSTPRMSLSLTITRTPVRVRVDTGQSEKALRDTRSHRSIGRSCCDDTFMRSRERRGGIGRTCRKERMGLRATRCQRPMTFRSGIASGHTGDRAHRRTHACGLEVTSS
jgi:hypothetical protein